MQAINELITYAIRHKLIEEIDTSYVYNRLTHLLHIKPTGYTKTEATNKPIDEILTPLLDLAYKNKLIQSNSIIERDLIESLIMDIFTSKPSDYQVHFMALLKDNPILATKDFYRKSIASNYIKTARIAKNKAFTVSSIYGDIDITINLSKPEKDPKAIALALKEEKTNYPDCLLCKENVGYYGSLNHPARSNHRVIKLAINEEPFYLQYSPYVYYNEHAILLHEDHIPMEISIKTFKRLLDFIDLMPHYFMGSNAGLPIVGGSILNHEHYQGGNADFPIYHAAILNTYQKEDVKYELLKWPLSVIRLTSPDKAMLIKHAEHLRATWLAYENSAQGIKAYTNETPHNAITPIARKQQGHYIIDIALRNNRTSDDFPDGIFHPHQSHHHIKKENIGLIEVMGLAILPGRLDEDLQEIKAILLKDKTTFDNITPYKDWIETLKKLTFNPSHIDRFIEENVAKEFIEGLEDCGVFKQTETGLKHFNQFVKDLLACLPK